MQEESMPQSGVFSLNQYPAWVRGLILGMAVLLISMLPMATSVKAETIPTFDIISVVEDDTVTIETHNFPADTDFTVRMGLLGTRGVDGIQVATTNSGKGGSFQVIYKIPNDLKGLEYIAIRMDGTNGYYSYNWFSNSSNDAVVQPSSTPAAGDGKKKDVIPTITIVGVEKDARVIIRTHDFPANLDFTVRMGKIGTQGVNGTAVTTINSGSGGVFEATFNIPEDLFGSPQIAIRLETPNGFYAYNWFNNYTENAPADDTSGGGPQVDTSYTGYPTFSIVSVKRDDQVVIQTNNLPANTTFKVTMGDFGSMGIGGTEVATTDSGEGGSQQLTYKIPDGLKGLTRIAIRMDSGSLYAYNWFYNNSTP
jgi:hypothetical protein